MRAVLFEQGYEVSSHPDGSTAWLALLDGQRCETLLLDCREPGPDELALLRLMREDGKFRHVPLLVQGELGDVAGLADYPTVGSLFGSIGICVPLMLNVVASAVAQFREQEGLRSLIGAGRSDGAMLTCGAFSIRTLNDARVLARGLAQLCADPVRARVGMQELLFNAVEHGNLAIGYAAKGELIVAGSWHTEVWLRTEDPRYRSRRVTVEFERDAIFMSLTIRDQGAGFDWRRYLVFSQARAFDPNGRGILLAHASGFAEIDYFRNGAGDGSEVRIRIPLAGGT